MPKRKRATRRKSANSQRAVAAANVNPADYEIEDSPTREHPRWLADFARDAVWPFIDSHRKAATAALARWLDCKAAHDERLRQLANLDVEKRRLACSPETEDMAREVGNKIKQRVRLITSYNTPPLDLPLPPPADRTLPPDDCLVALLAVNDETRDPSQRIGPTDSSLYLALCGKVRELKEPHLPALRAMLTMTVPKPPTRIAGLALAAGGFVFGERVYDLSDRPRDMLKVLLNSRHRRCTVSFLREAMKIDEESVTFPEQVVKDAAKALRAALKQAASAVGYQCDNPLPSTGKGADLTYSLAIP